MSTISSKALSTILIKNFLDFKACSNKMTSGRRIPIAQKFPGLPQIYLIENIFNIENVFIIESKQMIFMQLLPIAPTIMKLVLIRVAIFSSCCK